MLERGVFAAQVDVFDGLAAVLRARNSSGTHTTQTATTALTRVHFVVRPSVIGKTSIAPRAIMHFAPTRFACAKGLQTAAARKGWRVPRRRTLFTRIHTTTRLVVHTLPAAHHSTLVTLERWELSQVTGDTMLGLAVVTRLDMGDV